MNEFNMIMDNYVHKVEQLENLIALLFRKNKILPKAIELNEQVTNVKLLITDCKNVLNRHDELKNEFKATQNKIHKLQLAMLSVLSKLGTREKPNYKSPNKFLSINNAANLTQNNLSVQGFVETPRMYLSDYERSPFVTKVKPICLQFVDFEITITAEQFENIPKYMRGRETLDTYQQFLAGVIIPCFTEKYQLLPRKRGCLKNRKEIELWNLYREQANDFPRIKFITEGDISRKIGHLIDKKIGMKITGLRHLGILQEQRKNSTIYYIWTAN